jgi:hypothetical protein
VRVTACGLLLLLAAGCAEPPAGTAAAPGPGAAPVEVALDCSRSLEVSALGSCWGHFGHHTYLLPEEMLLGRIEGNLTAVEAEAAGYAQAAIGIDVSLDGRSWTDAATVPYPAAGTGLTEERHRFAFAADLGGARARLLRIHMPLSSQEGLAGYLDASDFRLQAVPLGPAPPPEPATASDCAQGLPESFHAGHPCWFGGRDPLDGALGQEPDTLHLAPPTGSYYDAASFLHTHPLWGVHGPFQAWATVGHWRSANHLASCGAQGREARLQPTVVAQASGNGTHWTEVGRATGAYGDSIPVAGSLPPGTIFVRLMATVAPGNAAAPSCHHPVGFLTHSAVRVDAGPAPGSP